jgi:hypothetical protein
MGITGGSRTFPDFLNAFFYHYQGRQDQAGQMDYSLSVLARARQYITLISSISEFSLIIIINMTHITIFMVCNVIYIT